MLDRKITVRSKIIYQLKRERQLSQHIKFNDFRLWTTRDVKNSTSKIGENICPQLTLIDKRFLLHSVIVVTAYYIKRHFLPPGEDTNAKNSSLYLDCTEQLSFYLFIVQRGTKNARYKKNLATCGHFLCVFRFILDKVESGMEQQLLVVHNQVFICKRLRRSILESLMQRESAMFLLSSSN